MQYFISLRRFSNSGAIHHGKNINGWELCPFPFWKRWVWKTRQESRTYWWGDFSDCSFLGTIEYGNWWFEIDFYKTRDALVPLRQSLHMSSRKWIPLWGLPLCSLLYSVTQAKSTWSKPLHVPEPSASQFPLQRHQVDSFLLWILQCCTTLLQLSVSS